MVVKVAVVTAPAGWCSFFRYYRGRKDNARAFVAHDLLDATVLAGAQSDPAYLPVSLEPPYSELPDAPAGSAIEPGMPVKLEPRQLDAVVVGVLKWMKDPPSVAFVDIGRQEPAGPHCRLRRGRRPNSTGTLLAKSRFVGAMMGQPAAPDFVVSRSPLGQPRTAVEAICQQSGIFKLVVLKRDLKPRTLDDVGLKVADMDRILPFYCDGLGLKLLRRKDKGPSIASAVLAVGTQEMNLFSNPDFAGVDSDERRPARARSFLPGSRERLDLRADRPRLRGPASPSPNSR